MLVGVKGFLEAIVGHDSLAGTLKKEALLVDKIAIPNFSEQKTGTGLLKGYEAELEWLFEHGLIYEPPSLLTMELPILDENFDAQVETLKALRSRLENDLDLRQHLEEMLDVYAYTLMLTARLTQVYLQNRENVNTCCLYFTNSDPDIITGKRHDVIQAVFNALPLPAKDTPWEHILEFRSDPDSYRKFLALRNWVNEISATNMSAVEIEEKLEFLIEEYQNHMALHRMKTNTGFVESIVVSTAELAEDLVKVKWGKLARNLFSLHHRKISLMDAESSAPGRQVAYIVNAQDTFLPQKPY